MGTSDLECIRPKFGTEEEWKPVDNQNGQTCRSDWAGNQEEKNFKMVKTISLLFWQTLWAAEIEKGELEIPSRNLCSSYTYEKILILGLNQALILMLPLRFMKNNESILSL